MKIMKIRWTGTTILGSFHNDANGIKTGQIVDLDPVSARRYIHHEMAELVEHADEIGARHF